MPEKNSVTRKWTLLPYPSFHSSYVDGLGVGSIYTLQGCIRDPSHHSTRAWCILELHTKQPARLPAVALQAFFGRYLWTSKHLGPS